MLKRTVATITFLCLKDVGLGVGLNEHLGNLDRWNFLGLPEFLFEFDSFLAQHLKNCGGKALGIHLIYLKRCIKSLSPLCLIRFVKVTDVAREAKYFGIMVDPHHIYTRYFYIWANLTL